MKIARFYALITQYILQTILLVLLGMYIGNKIDPDSILKGILGTVGGILGIILFIIFIIKEGSKDGRKGKPNRRDENLEGGDSEA